MKSAVETVTTEENSNFYRQFLLNLFTEEESRLFQKSERISILQNISDKSADTALIIELVK
jgi:hypothetical protein